MSEENNEELLSTQEDIIILRRQVGELALALRCLAEAVEILHAELESVRRLAPPAPPATILVQSGDPYLLYNNGA